MVAFSLWHAIAACLQILHQSTNIGLVCRVIIKTYTEKDAIIIIKALQEFVSYEAGVLIIEYILTALES